MTTVDYNVSYAVHPGEYLKMELEARELKQKDFAEILDISKEEVNLIANGKRNITPRLAARIGQAFDTWPEIWINAQIAYDLWMVKQNKKEEQVLNIIPERMSVFYRKSARELEYA